MFEVEYDVVLVGIISEPCANIIYICCHFRLFAVQVHLFLVNLSDVKNLVDKQQKPLCVAVDGLYVVLAFGICQSRLQLVERAEDKCQRRPDVVGRIDEEPHLGLL